MTNDSRTGHTRHVSALTVSGPHISYKYDGKDYKLSKSNYEHN